ncbi:MAG: disulfide bond formation protein B [Betaproteobacteria bacterium]|nr:disulfide bond formation protein B [Betaproteobacteria bacterium]
METRYLFPFVFLVCALLLASALYLQDTRGLMPCALCVAQRIAYWLLGLWALAAFLHRPRGMGSRIYSGVLVAGAAAGLSVALRQLWLIHHPGFLCGISPEDRLINALPLARWWPGMFVASGSCSAVRWTFLSLSMPDWSAVWFALIAAVAAAAFRSHPRRRAMGK